MGATWADMVGKSMLDVRILEDCQYNDVGREVDLEEA